MRSDGARVGPRVDDAVPAARDGRQLDEMAPEAEELTAGVCNAVRLSAVDAAELPGHLSDPHLDAVVSTLTAAVGVPVAVVNVVRHDLQTYPAEFGIGAPHTFVVDRLSPCAEVVATGRSLTICNLREHPVYAQNPLVQQGLIAAYAGEPLIDDGVVLGAVSVFDSSPREFSPAELSVLHNQARLASAVVELRRCARTDSLTGLPNRALIFDRLALAIRRLDRAPGAVVVLFVDVDNFKSVNDQYGHDCGDRLLVELARRLSGGLRRGDTLGRFGGDEFVIICEGLTDEDGIDTLRQRFLQTLHEPVDLNGFRLNARVSVGGASTTSAGDTSSELLRAADAAMYHEKAIKRPAL